MDKTKAPPIPAKTTSVQSKEGVERKIEPPKSTSEQPAFVRGTIDPPTKK